MIYLTCDGRTPSEWSIPKDKMEKLKKEGKLVSLSYRELLIPWFRECLKECEAEKIRWFIRDFISWIEKNCKEVSENGQEENN